MLICYTPARLLKYTRYIHHVYVGYLLTFMKLEALAEFWRVIFLLKNVK